MQGSRFSFNLELLAELNLGRLQNRLLINGQDA